MYMLSTIKKMSKAASLLAIVAFFSSCRKEGCPANQFSIDTDLVDVLAEVLNFLF